MSSYIHTLLAVRHTGAAASILTIPNDDTARMALSVLAWSYHLCPSFPPSVSISPTGTTVALHWSWRDQHLTIHIDGVVSPFDDDESSAVWALYVNSYTGETRYLTGFAHLGLPLLHPSFPPELERILCEMEREHSAGAQRTVRHIPGLRFWRLFPQLRAYCPPTSPGRGGLSGWWRRLPESVRSGLLDGLATAGQYVLFEVVPSYLRRRRRHAHHRTSV